MFLKMLRKHKNPLKFCYFVRNCRSYRRFQHVGDNVGLKQYVLCDTALNENCHVPGGEEGALECNLTERCPFFKNLPNPFRKKIEFRYPVSEFLDYKTIGKQ